MNRMNGAEIAATRHLVGYSQAELGEALGVGRHAVKDWESARFTPRPGITDDLATIRAEHDEATALLINVAVTGKTIVLPNGPRPRGWYVALGARVLAVVPVAHIEWHHATPETD